jgi:hypothetical protein
MARAELRLPTPANQRTHIHIPCRHPRLPTDTNTAQTGRAESRKQETWIGTKREVVPGERGLEGTSPHRLPKHNPCPRPRPPASTRCVALTGLWRSERLRNRSHHERNRSVHCDTPQRRHHNPRTHQHDARGAHTASSPPPSFLTAQIRRERPKSRVLRAQSLVGSRCRPAPAPHCHDYRRHALDALIFSFDYHGPNAKGGIRNLHERKRNQLHFPRFVSLSQSGRGALPPLLHGEPPTCTPPHALKSLEFESKNASGGAGRRERHGEQGQGSGIPPTLPRSPIFFVFYLYIIVLVTKVHVFETTREPVNESPASVPPSEHLGDCFGLFISNAFALC